MHSHTVTQPFRLRISEKCPGAKSLSINSLSRRENRAECPGGQIQVLDRKVMCDVSSGRSNDLNFATPNDSSMVLTKLRSHEWRGRGFSGFFGKFFHNTRATPSGISCESAFMRKFSVNPAGVARMQHLVCLDCYSESGRRLTHRF